MPDCSRLVALAFLVAGLKEDGTLVRLEGDPVSTVLERARTFEALSAPPGGVRFDGRTVTRVHP